jgi:hypothetical protein
MEQEYGATVSSFVPVALLEDEVDVCLAQGSRARAYLKDEVQQVEENRSFTLSFAPVEPNWDPVTSGRIVAVQSESSELQLGEVEGAL